MKARQMHEVGARLSDQRSGAMQLELAAIVAKQPALGVAGYLMATFVDTCTMVLSSGHHAALRRYVDSLYIQADAALAWAEQHADDHNLKDIPGARRWLTELREGFAKMVVFDPSWPPPQGPEGPEPSVD